MKSIFAASVLIFAVACVTSSKADSGDLEQAKLLLEHQQVDTAASVLASLLQREPRNASAWELMGIVQVQQGESRKAEGSFRQALSIQPKDIAAETNLGHLLLDQHRQSEAIPYLTDALRRDNANSRLREMLVTAAEGSALEQRAAGDKNAALATLLAANVAAPHCFQLLLDLSLLEDQLGLFQDADRDVHEVRNMHPDDLKALYTEARVKMDLQNMPAAAEDMRAYLKERPDDATAHYGLGRILQISQQPEEAKAEFARSIELAPNQAESYYQIGQIALDHGDYAEAQKECRKALDHDARHGGALTAFGIAAFRLRQYAEAAQALQAAVAAAPDYQPAHYYYGLTLARMGDHATSERELNLATEMADRQNHHDAERLELPPAASTQQAPP